jgi:catechol 2,3-dioxygenase
MAIKLERIGHCLLRVWDVERCKRFYIDVLGFQCMEEDPEHGGVFMSLPGDGHTIDLFPVEHPDSAPPGGGRDRLGLGHIAFKVASYAALEEAYNTLQAHGVEVHRMIDHASQRSIYFSDPEGNGLEIYYEYPRARELFLQGRGDQDRPFTFAEPLPEWATASS